MLPKVCEFLYKFYFYLFFLNQGSEPQDFGQKRNLCHSLVTKQHLLFSDLSHVQFPTNNVQVHSYVHTGVAKGAPAVLVHCRGSRRHAWTHQPRIRLLLLGRSQVRAAPRDFKGPCQCVLVEMRSGASAGAGVHPQDDTVLS